MSLPWPPIHTLRVRGADVTVYPPGATFGPRRNVDYEFVWIIEGGGAIHFDQHAIVARPGTILLCRPGMTDRYEWGDQDRTMHAFFHFDFELPRRGWPRPAAWPLARVLSSDDVLRPLFRYVLAVAPLPEPLRSSLLRTCVDCMLRSFISGKLLLAPEPHARLPAPVEQSLRIIHEATLRAPPHGITIAQLARGAHVSPEHLSRLFRQSLNLTPRDCVRFAKIERAATLLRRSNLTIKEAAESAGFPNPFYFSRVFHQTFKTPPSVYRELIRKGGVPRHTPMMRFLHPKLPRTFPAARRA
ncbi:MAG: helix-turn-helix transcriptional regulator [Verrucomicrobia bacterium]|nr:helix-turn-helix transcriptional regulator [Verrucomicrobiota bacterium]